MEVEQKEIEAIGGATDYGALVNVYVTVRDKKEEIKRRYAEATSPLDAYLDAIEGRIMALLQESGQESAKTKFGTAFTVTKSSVKVADWNVFIDYVKKHDAYDLLTKAVAKDAVKARMDENGEIVPGLDMVTFKEVQVRKPR